MSRMKAARTVANALGVNVKFLGVDVLLAGPPRAANSNDSPPAQSVVGFASAPEALRLFRAFNSIKDGDLRRIVLKFIESTAGTEHNATSQD